MPVEKPTITISQSDVDTRLADIARLEAELAEAKEWVHAAEFLLGQRKIARRSSVVAEIKAERDRTGGGGSDGQDLTRAIEEIASKSEKPLTKKTMKEMLRGSGFEESRLQNYFYTAISRLKTKGRIQVLDDGKIWKPL